MNALRTIVPFILGLCAVPLFAEPSSGRTEIPNAAQPQLAVATDGRVWLVYGQSTAAAVATATPQHAGDHAAPASQQGHGDGKQHKGHGAAAAPRMGDIFVASSNDGGATFGSSVKVGHVPGLALGMHRGPRIVAQGDRITVTVVGNELLAFTSIDGGKTWSEPAVINDVPTSAREGLHDLAGSRDGQVFVTWLDLRNGKTELWGATSKDGGRTWAKNEQVYKSPDKSICECCHPSAVFDEAGNLAVMWRNSIEGYRDMWMTTRPKGSNQFTAAHKLGEGSWKLNACPMDGGRIVALGGGRFAAVWQRNGDVFLTPADGSPEILLGKGKQPLAVTRGGETTVIWQQGNDLVLAKPGMGKPTKLAADARFAVIVPSSGEAIIAYEHGPAKEKQPGIVVQRL